MRVKFHLVEKRKHPRNEAERVLRQQDRHQRGVRRAEKLRGLEAAGGTKTYVAQRKANLQRKREKRQFDQSMGNKEDGFKKFRQGNLKEFLGMDNRKQSKVQRTQAVKNYNVKTGRRLSKTQTNQQGNVYKRNVARYQSGGAKAREEAGFKITGQVI